MENWIKKWTMTEWGKTAYNTLQIYGVKYFQFGAE
jgi:hypothetical protein